MRNRETEREGGERGKEAMVINKYDRFCALAYGDNI